MSREGDGFTEGEGGRIEEVVGSERRAMNERGARPWDEGREGKDTWAERGWRQTGQVGEVEGGH